MCVRVGARDLAGAVDQALSVLKSGRLPELIRALASVKAFLHPRDLLVQHDSIFTCSIDAGVGEHLKSAM